jgi:conjugal transfer pilus assembly protein TraV
MRTTVMHNRITRIGLLLASGATLTMAAGCASVVEEAAVPGSSGYSCSGVPDGVVCAPARQMYGLTEDADRINKADLEARGLATDGARDPDLVDAVPPPAGPRTGVVDAGALVGQPLTPPILVSAPAAGGAPAPEGALRIWIAPWRDEAGTLRAPGFLYADLGAAAGRSGEDNLLQTPEMIRAREEAARPPASAATPPGPRQPGPPPRASPAPPAGPPSGPRTFSVNS